jgi:phosphoglycolate phosphatase
MIRHFFRGAMIRHVKNPLGYTAVNTRLPTKPDPTLALQLAERMNVKPNTIAIVGDMPVDIQTAKNGGMIPIGAAWGFSSREALKAAGARMIFDSPGDLATYLETMPLV